MAPESSEMLFISAQLSLLEDDLDRLVELAQSPKIPEEYTAIFKSRLNLQLQKLKKEPGEIRTLLQAQEYQRVYELMGQLKERCQSFQDLSMEFLGGLAIRKKGLDRGMADAAQSLLQGYCNSVGVNWSPAVIIAGATQEGFHDDEVHKADPADPEPADNLVRIPIPRWDYWFLPLTARSLGYWIAKYQPDSGLRDFFDGVEAQATRILSDDPPSEDEIASFLPEIREMLRGRRSTANPNEYIAEQQERLKLLLSRQKEYMWQLAADAFASMIAGPAYVYALLFHEADPTVPLAEGETAERAGIVRSRSMPCDARRLVVCIRTLERMDEHAKVDIHSPGRLTPDLKRLQGIFESALAACGNADAFKQCRAATQSWADTLAQVFIGRYGSIARDTVDLWSRSHQELESYFVDGLRDAQPCDLRLVVNAAWWCRARYPDLLERITQDGWRLLDGRGRIFGVGPAQPVHNADAETLLLNRIYDRCQEIETIRELFRSNQIAPVYRNSAAGRFYRLLSELDLQLGIFKKLVARNNPLGSSFEAIKATAIVAKAQAIQQEMLDFLGGIFMREMDLDHGVCNLADTLVRSFAQEAGVDWNSQVIPGRHPLFSPAVEYICLRFPDWDIWNLPLMVHELGHVAALTTPQFSELLAKVQANFTQLPPSSEQWTQKQFDGYLERRTRHFHELFADAFAIYSLGPAYLLDVVTLNFNPREAYLGRGDHPSHAERFRALRKMLENMNKRADDEKIKDPYVPVMKLIDASWNQAVSASGATPKESIKLKDIKFYDIKAATLVDSFIYPFLVRYFRLGIQYPASNWPSTLDKATSLQAYICTKQVDKPPDLAQESLHDLLNIAWICRIRSRDCADGISKFIRSQCEQRFLTYSKL